jgi:hypothetical protein
MRWPRIEPLNLVDSSLLVNWQSTSFLCLLFGFVILQSLSSDNNESTGFVQPTESTESTEQEES